MAAMESQQILIPIPLVLLLNNYGRIFPSWIIRNPIHLLWGKKLPPHILITTYLPAYTVLQYQIQLQLRWGQLTYILIISSLVLMTRLIILWVNVIVLCYVPERTPKYDGVFWFSYHLLQRHIFYWTCDWISRLVMFNHMLLCIDSIIFLYWIDLIRSSITNRSNYFLSGELI